MVKALFDTNILIDYLNAIPEARDELDRYERRAISIITWMDVLIGAAHEVEAATRSFLNSFQVIAVDSAIAEGAVCLRQRHRIKLPDAIIWSTADTHSLLLVTRNTKDFPADNPGIRVPYLR
ncbi:type II toxin-antitoxin system VapC family toxin [Rhizobium sullae]|uniref:PIN domain-containing protein n=1 Tax=Rhizobium sullae TaxID=50338 RepID=A0A2N0D294_RHISU|nr:type II toxin-antitoxin system VapC family toxin [Rhizobium sullae]PKA40209.1 PIN domain-containing protein [Rhizobium sullae]UWU15003.1 type II toxin-antitoxin system VapC family toxin [Rhizobium sullae]